MPRDSADQKPHVDLVRRQTDEGFRWLIENVGPRVKGLLTRKFGSRREDELETAIVEAAETLWLKGEPYDPERGSLLTWLYTAAARNLSNVLRAERARPLISEIPGDLLEASGAAAGTGLNRSERVAALLADLRECIDELTEREQEIILALLSEDETSDAELGRRLGTTDNVVRVTRNRARTKLGELMRRRHGE